jgi:hypothetical protein
MSQQPEWEFVANIGDVNVADYGGFLIFRDKTGVYAPEAEVYETDESGNGGTMYRFILEPPRFKTLSASNEWVWHNEWYVKYLSEVASSAGTTKFQLLRGLLSKDPLKRAIAYRDIVGHFGCFEFDQYPVTLTEEEAQKRYEKYAG